MVCEWRSIISFQLFQIVRFPKNICMGVWILPLVDPSFTNLHLLHSLQIAHRKKQQGANKATMRWREEQVKSRHKKRKWIQSSLVTLVYFTSPRPVCCIFYLSSLNLLHHFQSYLFVLPIFISNDRNLLLHFNEPCCPCEIISVICFDSFILKVYYSYHSSFIALAFLRRQPTDVLRNVLYKSFVSIYFTMYYVPVELWFFSSWKVPPASNCKNLSVL